MTGRTAIHTSVRDGPVASLIAGCFLFQCTLICGCERAHPVSHPEQAAYELSLATFDDQLAVAWHEGTRNHETIYLRWTDSSGNTIGDPLSLTNPSREAFEPDMAPLADDVVIAWYEKDRRDGSLTAQVARFTQSGDLQWRRELSGRGTNGRNPVVRVTGNEIAVAWIETPSIGEAEIWGVRLQVNGDLVAPPMSLASASPDTWNLNAAVDDSGAFYVVYDARHGARAKELRLLKTDHTSVTEHALSADDGFESTYPDLSLSGNRAAVTWFDDRDGNTEIYLFAGKIEDLASQIDTEALRVTHTPGSSIGANLTWNGARLGLAWCDDTSGQYEVHTQIFDALGMALGAARQITHNSTSSLIPAIRPWRTGFAVAWNEYQPAGEERSPLHASAAMSTAMLELIP